MTSPLLTVRELKGLALKLDDKAFGQQLGPFVLVERPFKRDKDSAGSVKVTKPLKDRSHASVFDFDDLWVAALPPLEEKSDSFVVGRSPDCDLVLDEGTVSKHHAKIHWAGQHAELEDLESSNGTWLNGTKLAKAKPTRLKDNDSIDFGGVQVYFLLAASLRKRMGKS